MVYEKSDRQVTTVDVAIPLDYNLEEETENVQIPITDRRTVEFVNIERGPKDCRSI